MRPVAKFNFTEPKLHRGETLTFRRWWWRRWESVRSKQLNL